MNAAEFSPGDIVLITHIPLDDPSAIKARPALIVSGSSFNIGNVDVIIVAISSVVRAGDTKQIVVRETDSCFSQTGLKLTSAIKCGAILSYPKRNIRRKIGTVPEEVLQRTRSLLIEFITGV